ncbi:MAG: hypothetical protein V3S03_07015 [Vicinamibacteria bacterium]
MIPSDLPLEFVRVVEQAAIEAARTMGQGDGQRAGSPRPSRGPDLVMTTSPPQVRFIDTIHVEDAPDAVVRF